MLAGLLEAHGLAAAIDGITPMEASQFLHEIRVVISTDETLLYSDTRSTGWAHHDTRLLQSAGDFSRGFARGLTRR